MRAAITTLGALLVAVSASATPRVPLMLDPMSDDWEQDAFIGPPVFDVFNPDHRRPSGGWKERSQGCGLYECLPSCHTNPPRNHPTMCCNLCGCLSVEMCS